MTTPGPNMTHYLKAQRAAERRAYLRYIASVAIQALAVFGATCIALYALFAP